jgi:outer membrane protein OmpA-like peptidoglycan-associated protein
VQLENGEDVVLTVQGENVGYQSVVVHEQGSDASSAVALDLASAVETGGGSEDASHSKGNPFELQDVQFETKKSTLSKRSEIILRALANHLERQPELRLDIDGHTDDIGEAQDNLVLSQSRAEVVKAFLVACGVDDDRMTTQGHGESQPKTTNDTSEGRRVNRRTEFRWVD